MFTERFALRFIPGLICTLARVIPELILECKGLRMVTVMTILVSRSADAIFLGASLTG